MKHAYSFLAGVALVSLCVVATRSLPGYMFLVGFGVSVISHVLLVRAIGCSKVARLFLNLDSFRLAPHWSSGAYKRGRKTQDLEMSESVRSEKSESIGVQAQQGRVSHSQKWSGTSPNRATVGGPAKVFGKELPTRCNSSAARNANRRSVVQYREMLSSVHQDVLSALCNLKVPFAEAQEAVLAAGKDGQSFDELFKVALAHVNAGVGKSRRAA